jgi:hypothetical protein
MRLGREKIVSKISNDIIIDKSSLILIFLWESEKALLPLEIFEDSFKFDSSAFNTASSDGRR